MNKDFLYGLLRTHSVSGCEIPVEKKIYEYMQDKCDTVTVDEMGNVTACVNPESGFRVLLTGHCDEIGLMVTRVDNSGMVHVHKIGGVYLTTYPGHKVRIFTKKGMIFGAVVNNRSLASRGDLGESDLLIDIGAASREEAEAVVRVGDTVTFDTDVRELLNNRITARAMDDRIGAYIVMEAVALAKEQGADVGCYATSTVGEETTMIGAYFAAARVKPDIAIAVDVTYATDYPGSDSAVADNVKIGGGPVLCCSPAVHKMVNECLESSAAALGISVQYEVTGGRTGTDADVMHKTGVGVPFALVSIPLRYMHCPDEVGSLEDIENCIRLLAGFLCDMSEGISLRPF